MYLGPPIDDPQILELVPGALRESLLRCNGYVAYHGGLHLRGACLAPDWHSLRHWWLGPCALHKLFQVLRPDDIPFAEDALGDQYVLRGEVVHRLDAECGRLESKDVDLAEFDRRVREDHVDYLSLQPLQEFRAEGGTLNPGELLSVLPPFVIKPSERVVSYKAMRTEHRMRFLAEFSRQIADVPDGGVVEFRIDDTSAS